MQNDVYHRLHTINKKIYSVYYICESRIYGGPQLSRKNKICHGKIKFETTNSNYSRQTTNTHGKSKKQLLQFKIHHGKSKTLTAQAKHSRQKQIAPAKSNQEWRSAVVQVCGVALHNQHD